MGHLSNMCKSKGNFKSSGSGRVNVCESDTEEEDSRPSQVDVSSFELYTIANANISKPNNFDVNMIINKIPIDMVQDNRAVVTVMPDTVYFKNFNGKNSVLHDR